MVIITSLSAYIIKEVPLGFRKRFFSLPWRPWVKYTYVMEPQIYMAGDVVICHPDKVTEIRKAFTETSPYTLQHP